MTERRYVVDAWAWIEYLDGSEVGGEIRSIIEDEGNMLFTCSVTLSEVISKFLRRRIDEKIAQNAISALSKVVDADEDLAIQAAKIHAEQKKKVKDFGLADAYVLATARQIGAKIITGDAHFSGMPEAILFLKK